MWRKFRHKFQPNIAQVNLEFLWLVKVFEEGQNFSCSDYPADCCMKVWMFTSNKCPFFFFYYKIWVMIYSTDAYTKKWILKFHEFLIHWSISIFYFLLNEKTNHLLKDLWEFVNPFSWKHVVSSSLWTNCLFIVCLCDECRGAFWFCSSTCQCQKWLDFQFCSKQCHSFWCCQGNTYTVCIRTVRY